MFEDFMLALYGFEGDLFAKNSKGEFYVVGTIDGFQPGEIDILNEILICATNFCKLSEFCDLNEFHAGFCQDSDAQSAVSSDDNHNKSGGLYLNAFASGIRQLLSKYLERIVELERCALRCEQATFVRVRSALEPFAVAMTVVQNIVAKAERGRDGARLRGIQILDAIYRDLDALRTAGDEQIRQAAHSLIEPALRTFAFQTVSWLLRGSLYDPFNEHFVELDSDGASDSVGSPSNDISDAESDDDTEEMENLGSQHKSKSQNRMRGRVGPIRCRLRPSMCPTFFSTQLGEKIVAVGQLRALLTALRRRAANASSPLPVAAAKHSHRDERSQLGAAVFDEPASVMFNTSNHRANDVDESLFRQMAHELNRLFTLRDTEEVANQLRFDSAGIERCVDELRDAFASEFYNQAVANDSRLLSEIAVLRRFYLLADGTLYQTFIESLEQSGVVFRCASTDDMKDHVLAGQVRRAFRTALADTNVALNAPNSKESESEARRFEIVLKPGAADAANSGNEGNDTVFDRLAIRYQRDTSSLPFGTFVLHDGAITRLERAFRFLLKVRYARSLLNGALCVDLNRFLTRTCIFLRRRQNVNAGSSVDLHSDVAFFANVVRVRHELGAVFNELNYYLLIDSTDVEYSTLVRTLRADTDADGDARRTDLDTLRFAFDTFTSQLAARTFYFSRALQVCFAKLFAVAFSFARLVNELLSSAYSATGWQRARTNPAILRSIVSPFRANFAELEREFRDAVGNLLRTVSSGASVQPSAFLGASKSVVNDTDAPLDSRLIPAATGTLNQALSQFLLRLDFNAHFTRAYLPR